MASFVYPSPYPSSLDVTSTATPVYRNTLSDTTTCCTVTKVICVRGDTYYGVSYNASYPNPVAIRSYNSSPQKKKQQPFNVVINQLVSAPVEVTYVIPIPEVLPAKPIKYCVIVKKARAPPVSFFLFCSFPLRLIIDKLVSVAPLVGARVLTLTKFYIEESLYANIPLDLTTEEFFMPDLKKQLLFNAGKLKIYLVDGSAVRRDIDIEYVSGGHDLRYEYIPEGEIWLDDEQHEDELYPVLLHELHERQRMASGVTYEDAHNESSEVEHYYRKNREGIEEKIMQEVEKNLSIGMNKLSNAVKILE